MSNQDLERAIQLANDAGFSMGHVDSAEELVRELLAVVDKEARIWEAMHQRAVDKLAACANSDGIK